MGLGNQRRNDMWPEHEKMQKRSRKLQSVGDKLAQRRKTRASCPKRNAQARIEIEKAASRIGGRWAEDQSRTLNEAELDLEIRALLEGEGRRGRNAPQFNGCCLDSAILEQFIVKGTERAEQQFAILRSEIDTVDVQHQPRRRQHNQVPAEPSGKEQPAMDRSKRRLGRGAEKVSEPCHVGDPATWGVATEVFQLVLFLIPPFLHTVQEATEVNLTRLEEELRGRRQQKKTIRQQRQDLGRHVGEV